MFLKTWRGRGNVAYKSGDDTAFLWPLHRLKVALDFGLLFERFDILLRGLGYLGFFQGIADVFFFAFEGTGFCRFNIC